MMTKFLRMFLMLAVAGSMAFIGGCRSNKNSADEWGDENLYGEPLDGEYGLAPVDGMLPEGDRSIVDPVFFAYDSSTVNSEEAGKVEEVAKLISKNKYEGVIVEGHTDERGSREYNLALGERRSLAVRDYLISLGVDPAKIHTKSYGEEMPDNMGHDESAWRANRRAVFALY